MGNNVNNSKKINNKKKTKKAIIIVFAAICGFIVLCYAAAYAISKIGTGEPAETSNVYRFEYPNYDEDIFKDKKYMGYDRSVYYTSAEGYMTVSIDRDDLSGVSESYREAVLFLMDYIDAMINGDVEKYNSCYDPSYYTNGKKPKEKFTQQKLYMIKLTAVDRWYEDSESSGVTYYNIGIEYMIKNNNGTLRNDMGSDATRIIYLTIKEANGKFAITKESYVSRTQELYK